MALQLRRLNAGVEYLRVYAVQGLLSRRVQLRQRSAKATFFSSVRGMASFAPDTERAVATHPPTFRVRTAMPRQFRSKQPCPITQKQYADNKKRYCISRHELNLNSTPLCPVYTPSKNNTLRSLLNYFSQAQ